MWTRCSLDEESRCKWWMGVCVEASIGIGRSWGCSRTSDRSCDCGKCPNPEKLIQTFSWPRIKKRPWYVFPLLIVNVHTWLSILTNVSPFSGLLGSGPAGLAPPASSSVSLDSSRLDLCLSTAALLWLFFWLTRGVGGGAGLKEGTPAFGLFSLPQLIFSYKFSWAEGYKSLLKNGRPATS